MNTPHEPSPELAALLRLKRHEQPPPGYFDEFAHAFRERQRAELLRVSTWRLFMDRVGTHFLDWRFLLQPRWMVPLGAASALLMGALFFRQPNPTSAGELTNARESATATLRPVAVMPLPAGPGRASLPRGAVLVSTQAAGAPTGAPTNGLRRTPGDALVPVLPSMPEGSPLQADHGKVIILVR